MKLVACDFDGTLYRDGAVSDADRLAVARFRAQGGVFGIVTGRGYPTLVRELKRFAVDCDFFICNNGALVLDSSGRELCRTELDADMRLFLLCHPALKDASHCALFDGRMMSVLEGKANYWVNPAYPMPVSRLEDALGWNLQQISLAYPDRETARIEGTRLEQETGGRVSLLRSLTLVDIVDSRAGKAKGLQRLMRLKGWQPESVTVLGDDGNDIDMLQEFHGFAMEHAAPSVREASSGTVASVQELLDQLG